MNRSERAEKIHAAISHALLHEWDPLNIRAEAECVDEYRPYVGGVYRLLASGATAAQIAEHLAHLEHTVLGCPATTTEQLLPFANRLCELDVCSGPSVNSE